MNLLRPRSLWWAFVFFVLAGTAAIPSAVAGNIGPTLTVSLPLVVKGAINQSGTMDLQHYFRDPDVAGTVVEMDVVIRGEHKPVDIALYDDATPVTVANFMSYVNSGAYVNTFFHRALSGFVVQAGGYRVTGNDDIFPDSGNVQFVPASGQIVNEFSATRSNVRGTLAMAKVSPTDASGNPIPGGGPDSATNQWFINLVDNSGYPPALDSTNGGYTVFGRVLGDGMSVMDQIGNTQTFDYSSYIYKDFANWPLTNRSQDAYTSTPITTGTDDTIPQSQLIRIASVTPIPALKFDVTSLDTSIVTTSTTAEGVVTLQYVASGTATVLVKAIDRDGASSLASFDVSVGGETARLVSFDSDSTTTSGSAQLRVVRSGTGGAFTVNLNTVNGTAKAGVDYVAVSKKLSFSASENEKVVTIPLLKNLAAKDVRSFGVVLKGPTGGTLLGTLPSTVVSIDNSAAKNGVLQLSGTTYTTDQGSNWLKVFVTRSLGTSGTVSAIIFSFDETAVTSTDYLGVTKTITFADGDNTPKTVMIPILASGSAGPVKFGISLSSPTGGAALGTAANAEVTITGAPSAGGKIDFLQPDFRVLSTSGTATITVRRLVGTSGTITVGYSTSDGTGVAGINYSGTSGTLIFQEGETEKTFTVSVKPDKQKGIDRTVVLTLGQPQPTGTATLGTVKQATLTIVQPSSKLGVISFPQSTFRIDEGASSSVSVPVNRQGNTAQPAEVLVRLIPETAIYNTSWQIDSVANYGALNGSLLRVPFSANQASSSVQVDLGAVDSNASFRLQIVSVSEGFAIGAMDQLQITICDTNTNLAGGVEFASTTYQVYETNGQVNLTVIRTGSSGTISVPYSTSNGTAIAGKDYTAVTSGTLTIADGLTSGTISIPIISGSADGISPRTFSVNLGDPTGGASLAAKTSSVVSILDVNNPNGMFEMESSSYLFNEDIGWAQIVVVRKGGTKGAADVSVGASDSVSDSLRNALYLWNSADSHLLETIHFVDGQDRQILTVPIIDGYASSSGTTPQVFSVTLVKASAGLIGPNSQSVIAIAPSMNVLTPQAEFSQTQYRFERVGNTQSSVVVTVKRFGPTTDALSIPLQVSNETAVGGLDYEVETGSNVVLLSAAGSTLTGTVTIPANADSVPISIKLKRTSYNPGERRFSLTLSGTSVLANSTATVTIADDRIRGGLFEFEKPTYIADQDGGLVTVNVIRKGGLGATASAYVETADGSAQGLEFGYNSSTGGVTFVGYHNYVNKSEVLTFGPNETNKSFTFRVLNIDSSVSSWDFLAKIRSAVGAGIGQTNFTDITLYNPTAAETSAVDLEKSSYDFDEDANTVPIRVRRADVSGSDLSISHPIDVAYTLLNGSAKYGTDATFVVVSGSITTPVSSSTGTVTIPANSSFGEITLQVKARPGQQGNRSFNLRLDGAKDSVTLQPVNLLANTLVPVTIHDLNNPLGVFEFNSTNYTFSGSSSNATITIVRHGPTNTAAFVKLQTEDGSAAQGVDYNGGSLTLRFPPGSKNQSINVSIPLLSDSGADGTLQFFVSLVPLNGAGSAAITETSVNLTH